MHMRAKNRRNKSTIPSEKTLGNHLWTSEEYLTSDWWGDRRTWYGKEESDRRRRWCSAGPGRGPFFSFYSFLIFLLFFILLMTWLALLFYYNYIYVYAVKFRFFIFIVDFCLMWIKIFYMFMSYRLILQPRLEIIYPIIWEPTISCFISFPDTILFYFPLRYLVIGYLKIFSLGR